MNHVNGPRKTAIGLLVEGPDLCYRFPHEARATATLAFERKPSNNGKEKNPKYIKITVLGNDAEFLGRFFTKGNRMIVTGRVQHWYREGNNGEPTEEWYEMEVEPNNIGFCGSREEIENFRKTLEADENVEITCWPSFDSAPSPTDTATASDQPESSEAECYGRYEKARVNVRKVSQGVATASRNSKGKTIIEVVEKFVD